jgi:hypothetical protein
MARSKNTHQDQMDPRLYEQLDLLRPTSPRNPEAAAQGRARFLTELETLELASPEQRRKGILPTWFTERINRRLAYAGNRTARFSLSSAFLVITLLAFLFGGAGMTAYAAQSALPGDILYPVKSSLEQAQLALSANPAGRAELQMGFAERRLDEIAGLIKGGQFENIPTATDQFEAYIRNIMIDVEDIRNHDPELAAQLSTEISSAFSRYTYTMSSMLEQVPGEVQEKMMRAIQNTWLTGNIGEITFNGAIDSLGPQAWVIAGQAVAIHSATEVEGNFAVGDVVQVRAVRNEDGSLSARNIVRVFAGIEGSGSAQPGDSGAGGSGSLMGGSSGDDQGSGLDQNTGTDQTDGQSGSVKDGLFQNQPQEPGNPNPGSGNGTYQSPSESPGVNGYGTQDPNDKDD